MNPLILITTTVASSADADRLAAELIQLRLAACVQIEGPIVSHYRWQERLHVDDEYRLQIKTRLDRWPDVRQWAARSHPYEQPELIVTRIDDASPGYHDWVITQTT